MKVLVLLLVVFLVGLISAEIAPIAQANGNDPEWGTIGGIPEESTTTAAPPTTTTARKTSAPQHSFAPTVVPFEMYLVAGVGFVMSMCI